jgi:hypothetical protein
MAVTLHFLKTAFQIAFVALPVEGVAPSAPSGILSNLTPRFV